MARTRPPPQLSEGWLREESLRYLQRYLPSERRMREVLARRVRRCVDAGTAAPADGPPVIDRVIAGLYADGMLDDARVARAWVGSLHRQGDSRRKIQFKLRQKGLAMPLIAVALSHLEADEGVADPELQRAIAYVRRRRLGPLRGDPATRQARRERDLGAVARAGFSFTIALRVIDCADLDLLEEEVGA